MEKYRFDDAYEKVYQYVDGDYMFIGNYLAFGIDQSQTDAWKSQIIEQEVEYDENV